MLESIKAFLGDPSIMEEDIENPVLLNLLADVQEDFDRLVDADDVPIQRPFVAALLKVLLLRDSVSFRHSLRCAKYSVLMGQWLKLDRPAQQELVLVALLHDIGKVGVPDDVLFHTGELPLKAFELMKRHTKHGRDILRFLCDGEVVPDGVYYHHERVDGYGYPEGRSGESIPLVSRVTLILDTFDAMTSNRPYRVGLSHEDAFAEIGKVSGKQLDRDLAQVFVQELTQRIKIVAEELGVDKLPKVGKAKVA